LKTTRQHKLEAIRGLILSWAMLQMFVLVAKPPFLQLQDWAFRFWGESLSTHTALFFVEATIALLIGSVIGVPISRWHQPHHIPVVLLFVATHVSWICGGLATWNLMHGYASFRRAFPYTVRIIGWECLFISAVVWAGILHAPYETGSEQPPATL